MDVSQSSSFGRGLAMSRMSRSMYSMLWPNHDVAEVVQTGNLVVIEEGAHGPLRPTHNEGRRAVPTVF
eukprot:4449813-Pyramimonas_sp.AAC.1